MWSYKCLNEIHTYNLFDLKTARRSRELRHSSLHNTQLFCLIICQRIHRRQRQIESIVRMVYRDHINRLPVILQLPASAATGRIPTSDCSCSTNVGEVLERAEGCVALSFQAVGTIGTGDNIKGIGFVIINGVVGDLDRGGRCSEGGNSAKGEGDNGCEAHDDRERG